MIEKNIATFVRVEQPVVRDVTCLEMVGGHSSLTKRGKIRLLTQNGRCLSC